MIRGNSFPKEEKHTHLNWAETVSLISGGWNTCCCSVTNENEDVSIDKILNGNYKIESFYSDME